VTSLIVPGPGAVALLDGRSGPHTIVVVRSDAERVALEISEPREIQFDGQPVVMWFGRDVTASQHALHAQLVRADRMAVVGRLAAGLAHELNNPLAALTLDVSHLKEVVPSAEPTVSAVLADVGAGIARIAAIVRELGTVSFREREPVNAVDVVTTLRLVLEIAAPEIQGHAEIRAELEPVPPISIAKSHLVQALLNLLIAVRAMDDDNRGAHTITVRTHTNAIGRVEIEIGGTALSIPPEDRERVFEPFFSTRADGFGGGLGLYHCQAVIAAASGTVTTSTSSRGTTFHISFPPAQMAGRAEGCDAAPDPLRVLVIDDEPAVGRAIKRLLVDCDVTVATSGTEGIARYEEHAPDLVLCDIMMPGLSGPGVYERLVSRDLGLANRIVFMTGGAFTKNTRKFVESTPSRVLKKPVELATLREVIAEHRVRPRVRGGDATGRDHHSRGVDRDEPSARRSS
jgi:signal transduction histidine kinase/CheY-like chemotaxis protein